MSRLVGSEYDLLTSLCAVGFALAIGMVSGGAHSLLLWRSLQILLGGGSALHAAFIGVARIVLPAAALAVTWRSGVSVMVIMLVGLLGFIAGRNAVLRSVGVTR